MRLDSAMLSDPRFGAPGCPSRVLLEHVTSKWGVLVLLRLAIDGTLRWAELKRALEGVSEKMLISTLRTLEADGLVLREALPVVPPHVEYSLTDTGREATGLLAPLVEWTVSQSA